jgi:hypothetical protein
LPRGFALPSTILLSIFPMVIRLSASALKAYPSQPDQNRLS